MSGINKAHAWERNDLSSECYGRCKLTAATILYRAVNRLASQCCSLTYGARGNGLHQQDIPIGIGRYYQMRNKLHWSELALWSCELSRSRNSQSFIKLLSTLPCSNKPITRLCTWLHVHGLHAYIVFFLINRPIVPIFTTRFLLFRFSKLLTHSSHPHAFHMFRHSHPTSFYNSYNRTKW
jgi:hypothetical protein